MRVDWRGPAFLELVPFSSSIVGLGWLCSGLALVSRDGLLVLISGRRSIGRGSQSGDHKILLVRAHEPGLDHAYKELQEASSGFLVLLYAALLVLGSLPAVLPAMIAGASREQLLRSRSRPDRVRFIARSFFYSALPHNTQAAGEFFAVVCVCGGSHRHRLADCQADAGSRVGIPCTTLLG